MRTDPHADQSVTRDAAVKIADQVWVVVALLHREHPDRDDFGIDEILERAQREPIAQPFRPSFHVHLVQHCVANRPPNPGRWRMVVETAPGRRRLFRPDDAYHPARANARAIPEAAGLPAAYQGLLTWYRREHSGRLRKGADQDPLIALHGSGRALWADEPADEYVRRLREGWA